MIYVLFALWFGIELNSALTTCGDTLECQGNTITDTSIYCSGSGSCQHAIIEATSGGVVCHGFRGCRWAAIQSPTEILGHSKSSLRDANLSAPLISSMGLWGLRDSYIETNSALTYIVVKSKGVDTGLNAKFLCRSGTTCRLECEGSGCRDFEFECELGATCTVFPSACSTSNGGTEQDCAICPSWSII